jgi:hypothetical protein
MQKLIEVLEFNETFIIVLMDNVSQINILDAAMRFIYSHPREVTELVFLHDEVNVYFIFLIIN